MGKLSFLFLAANSPWTYGLAEALAQNYPTHAVQFYDWRTYYPHKPTWSKRIPPPLLNRSIHVLPSGYAGRLEKLFRFYLQQLIQNWCRQLNQKSGEHPWLIVPHPDFAPWVRKIPNERLIYYNFDDYVLYRPDRKTKILEQEKELIERASITLCASNSQLLTLKKRHEQSSSKIHHYPHGFVKTYLNCQPEIPPEPMTVGYVGNLGDRLDWQLIYQVIKACPEITFIFVGGLDEQIMLDQGNWQAIRQAVLALPNVRHIGQVPSDKVAEYYWSFAVNWIPYVVDHPFNQASCPTKIMDGIASGHPVLSTDIPECRLYPEWISIFNSAEDASDRIRKQFTLVEKLDIYEKSLKQLEFARQHTWQIRAQTLENWLLQLY
ncbi:glycosyltransferase [Nostocaceae cyanobacterium CENA369]|uniref:Glycosyltransferase n=1 Tax=Dendronalium phyllosphericum CENA369 TaxID=1725256 RepID=A0A8J7LHU8_9NOST|nr:glycosyltransferase [Dendronalium phyllosphericum]MBH8576319.1 glycosyltransferase [Dendronalium phyllosphericum CENA369]